jgi:hypothetical protein
VIPQVEVENQTHSSVLYTLLRLECKLWEACQHWAAVIEAWHYECQHKLCSHFPPYSLANRMVEACCCHFSDVLFHGQPFVQADTQITDSGRWVDGFWSDAYRAITNFYLGKIRTGSESDHFYFFVIQLQTTGCAPACNVGCTGQQTCSNGFHVFWSPASVQLLNFWEATGLTQTSSRGSGMDGQHSFGCLTFHKKSFITWIVVLHNTWRSWFLQNEIKNESQSSYSATDDHNLGNGLWYWNEVGNDVKIITNVSLIDVLLTISTHQSGITNEQHRTRVVIKKQRWIAW